MARGIYYFLPDKLCLNYVKMNFGASLSCPCIKFGRLKFLIIDYGTFDVFLG